MYGISVAIQVVNMVNEVHLLIEKKPMARAP